MPSWLAHIPAAVGVAAVAAPERVTRRFWLTAAFCGILPDFDYLGAPFGIRGYSDVFGGHRGITHGIPFAIVVGSILAWAVSRDARSTRLRLRIALAVTLALLTHGILDAMTDVGPRIAFFSPFSAERFTFPWHPIEVKTVRGGPELRRAFAILWNEFAWGGLPGLLLLWLARRPKGPKGSDPLIGDQGV